MQVLPKSLRKRNRYLVFKVHADGDVDRRLLVKSILQTHLRLYGEAYAGLHGVWVLDYDGGVKKGVLKCVHKYVGEARAALTLVKGFGKHKGFIEVEKTCGTLKKARSLVSG